MGTRTRMQTQRESAVVFFRPDGRSGRQREDVRVGSLSADHLLQESGQLQSHEDTIQPPREQGQEVTLTPNAAAQTSSYL